MINGTSAWVGSAALGVLAAALAGLTLHSAPVPAPVADRFSEAWEADAAALNGKSNRLPLKLRETAHPLPPEPTPAPTVTPEPARELVQVAPATLASKPVETNLCTRHGLRKVWINSRHWRCR